MKPAASVRKWLVKLHRWFGLSAAIFLFIAGSTGAVIAWDHEVDAWLNPEFFRAGTVGQALPPAEIARKVEAADSRVRLRYMDLAAEPGHALAVFVSARVDPSTGAPFKPGYDQVFVDPVSGAIQGRRDWGSMSLARQNLVPFLYQLHYTMHLPDVGGIETGTFIMGVVAIAWVLDSLVAIWISFPRLKDWRRSLAFRWAAGGHRLTFDLHRSGGVWLFPLLLMVAVTSVSMNLEDEVMRPLVSVFSPLEERPWRQRDRPAEAADGEPLGLARAIDIASAEARRRGWTQAAGGVAVMPWSGLYSVGFFPSGGSHGESGLGPPWLHLDDRSGVIVGAEIPGVGSAGDLFMQSMLPLHSGRILGTAGRVTLSLLGVAIASFAVTGVVIWARKQRAQAAARQRSTQRLQPSTSP